MKAYILSILGIVVAGIIIDIIIPSGTINKYIKSIYSIFIVAVLIMPIINFLQNPNFSISYSDIELQKNVISYIYNVRVNNMEKDIENHFKYEGFNNLDIDISFSILNNEIIC